MQLQTKEVLLVKTERYSYYNLDSEGWDKLHFRFRLIRPVFSYGSNTKEFKKKCLLQGGGSKSFCWKLEEI